MVATTDEQFVTMKRLLGWCATLIGLFGVLIGIAVLSTRGQINPFASIAATPEGQPCANPCLFGVEPGITSYDEAIALLGRHPLTRQLSRSDSAKEGLITAVGHRVVISLHSSSSGVISNILLFFLDAGDDLPASALSTLYLGDAQLYFHRPARVAIATTPLYTSANIRTFASWYYDSTRLLLTARLTDSHVHATTSLTHIQLSDDRSDLGEFSPANFVGRVMITYTTERWLGFNAMGQYMHAAIKEGGVRQSLY